MNLITEAISFEFFNRHNSRELFTNQHELNTAERRSINY